jgi:hypothetical protein
LRRDVDGALIANTFSQTIHMTPKWRWTPVIPQMGSADGRHHGAECRQAIGHADIVYLAVNGRDRQYAIKNSLSRTRLGTKLIIATQRPNCRGNPQE